VIWDTSVLDTIDLQFLTSFQASSSAVGKAAENLAYFLALITLSFSVGMMIIKGEEVNAMFAKVIQTCLLFGLFFGLIEYGGTWIPEFLNGFIFVGQQASHLKSIDPSSIFNQGWYIASNIVNGANNDGLFHIISALTAIVGAFFILIIYALISASLCVLYVKAYALVLIGPIVFAMGNSDVTRSSVTNYIQKIIGMGFNLLMFYIVIGVGVSLGDQWAAAVQKAGIIDFSITGMIIGGVIVFYMVVQNVPSFIATISGATGFRDYGQATVAAAMTGAAVMGNTIMKAGALGGAGIGASGAMFRGASSMAGPAMAGASMGSNAVGSGTSSTAGAVKSFFSGGSGGMPGQQSAAMPKTDNVMTALAKNIGKGATGGLAGGVAGATYGLGKHLGTHAVKPAIDKVVDRFKGNNPTSTKG